MKDYILFSGELQGRFREVEIYPVPDSQNKFLVHWDGFEVGMIRKKDQEWHTDNDQLTDFVDELGSFIDHLKDQGQKV